LRAEQYIKAHEDGWRSAKHLAQWKSSLATYAFPVIGEVPAPEVTSAHIVQILRPIWTLKGETARRVRGRIEAVLDYAADPDDMSYRNPATMTPQLTKKLPRRGKREESHHKSMPYAEIPTFVADLRERDGLAALALEFAILTVARTGEVIGAGWEEIDRAAAAWTVPAARMKALRDHRVPLSDAALAVLDRVEGQQAEHIFGSLSDMAMLAVLRRMGRADVTVHGFRATFRTWAAETTDFPPDVCEAALAHVIKDKVHAAYQRGDLFKKRRELMAAWATYVCGVS
jgi:integrase